MLGGEPVEIVAYDPEWPARFDAEAKRIREALGEHLVAIEHVGSTAVVGLEAKPVIDVAAAIGDLERWHGLVEPLRHAGYVHQPAGDFEGRRYFRRFEGGIRIAHLSLAEADSRFWREHLAFRDALRSDPPLARRYAALKRELAARHRRDRLAYTDAKTDFVRHALGAKSS